MKGNLKDVEIKHFYYLSYIFPETLSHALYPKNNLCSCFQHLIGFVHVFSIKYIASSVIAHSHLRIIFH